MMLRVIIALAFVGLACGKSPKPVENPKLTADPKHRAGALIAQARNHAKNGDLDAADKAYADAYAASPGVEVLEERFAFLIHSGRTLKAQEVAKSYVDAHLTDPKGYELQSEALLAAGKGNEALEVADQLLQIKPDHAIGHEKRGSALMLLDRADEALDELRKARDADPKNATFHVTLGKALDTVKKVDDAALEFQAALKFAPDNAEIYVLLGRVRREKGELGDAKTYLDKAIELDRNNGRAYFELGLLYDKENKESEAEEALAQAVHASPNESMYWYAYAEVLRAEDRIDDAVKGYKQAVALENPYPKAVQKYVPLLIERKQYDEAEGVLAKAIDKDPRNAGYYLHLGRLFAATKKNKLAIEALQKYLEFAPKADPDRGKAQREINELRR
jgi:tetratricopeptide (TPR) repeat protein